MIEQIHYAVRTFNPSKIKGKLYNGANTGSRRCRFCGKVLDESHFTKIAHAISVSLGNTKFFCSDECDECNESFGHRLENDITNFFQVFLSLYQIPKRDGTDRMVRGRNFEMQMGNDMNNLSEMPILRFHLSDWKDDIPSLHDISKLMNNLDLSNKTFVPQNIYKAICKYALSLMPHSLTMHYQKTIEWIKSDSYEVSLPRLKYASYGRVEKEPNLMLFLRKTPNKYAPLCVVSLFVTNLHLLYVLPFCDESEGTEFDNIGFDFFWRSLCHSAQNGPLDSLFSEYVEKSFNDCDFSDTKRAKLQFEMDFKIEDGVEPIRLHKDEVTGQLVIFEDVK